MNSNGGSFDLGNLDGIFEDGVEPEVLKPDFDEETLLSLFNNFEEEDESYENVCEVINASTSNDEALKELAKALEAEHKPPVIVSNPRFKTISDEELKEIENGRQSKATKSKTKWGVKIFQDWSVEKFNTDTNLHQIEREELCGLLRHFYAEVQPKFDPKKSEQPLEYHKNTLKSIRSALNRHLNDIGRDFDIVRDKVFKSANAVLDGKLKQNMKSGLSRPTQHKAVVNSSDLLKISHYLSSIDNPVILRYRVWYDLSIHFVSRGLEFHQQLKTNSFEFLHDENGTEYVVISHETKQKNWQGGLDTSEAPQDKRMYSTGDENCPVRTLRQLIDVTDPNATSLFNHCSKAALASPQSENVWFTAKSVKAYQFSKFMSDISRNSGCSHNYTAHCLRATAIQALNDDGFELRHIMFMSGHRNEASVRSYNRDCSDHQKQCLSNSLAKLARPSTTLTRPPGIRDNPHENPTYLVSESESTTHPAHVPRLPLAPISNLGISASSSQQNSSNFVSTGFISNSSFLNCTFQFTGNPFPQQ